MATTETINVEVLLNDPDFQKGLKRLIKGITSAKKKTEGFGAKAKKVLAAMNKMWIAIAGAVYGVIRALKGAVEAAGRFEIAQKKFQTVFRGVTDEAGKMREELVKGYALSRREATEFLSSVQDLLVPLGLSRQEAAKMSGEVVKLASDIARFNPAAESMDAVMRDIQSAMVGNFETVRKYGVTLNQAVVEQEAMRMGLVKSAKEVDALVRAQVAMQLITRGSADAIKAHDDTLNTWRGTMQRVKALAEDIKVVIGEELIDAMSSASGGILEFVESADALTKVRNATHLIIGAFKILWQTIDFIVNAAVTQVTILIELFGNFFKFFRNNVERMGRAWHHMLQGNLLKAAMEFKGMNDLALELLFQPFRDNIADLRQEWEELTAGFTFLLTERAEAVQNQVKEELVLEKNAVDEKIALKTNELSRLSTIAKAETEIARREAEEQMRIAEAEAAFRKQLNEGIQASHLTAISQFFSAAASLSAKDFKRQKRLAIVAAFVEGASATIKALGTPPVPNIPLALATALQVAAQIATIKAQKAPEYAEGGIAGARGPELIQVGERGRELVLPNNVTERLLAALSGAAGGGTYNMNIQPGAVQMNVVGGTPGNVRRETYQGLRDLGDEFGRGNLYRG